MPNDKDDPLEWHVVFDDGEYKIYATDLFDGVLLGSMDRQQFVPGYRVKYEPEMDRARLVRR